MIKALLLIFNHDSQWHSPPAPQSCTQKSHTPLCPFPSCNTSLPTQISLRISALLSHSRTPTCMSSCDIATGECFAATLRLFPKLIVPKPPPSSFAFNFYILLSRLIFIANFNTFLLSISVTSSFVNKYKNKLITMNTPSFILVVHSSFNTLFTYSFLKSFTSNLLPLSTSANFSQILAAKHKQAITKKNSVW